MPPQSRGSIPLSGSIPTPESIPPTLHPYLDNLPSPTSIIADQLTPTPSEAYSHVMRDTPTPTGSRRLDVSNEEYESKDIGSEDEKGDENNEEEEGEEDDEFESHYSRHSSPASTASSSENEDEAEWTEPSPDESKNTQEQSFDRPKRSLQRISSLPVSAFTESNGHISTSSRLHTSQSTTSLPPPPSLPPPLPLYPPFYNRPPTPLPPSPSLTSLLRPPSLLNRSTTSTRPTTPDSSDVETPNDTEAAVAHSARRAHPLPPTAPKVPTYEYYGFVLYLTSSLTFLMYLLWSYLPSPFLHALGITYYPNRWWSIAIPAWIVMLLVFIYVALLSYNVEYLTLPLASLECMVDEAGNVAVLDEAGKIRKGGSKRFVQQLEAEKKDAREGKSKNKSTSGRKGKSWRKHSNQNRLYDDQKDDEVDAGEDFLLMRKRSRKNDQDSYYGIVGSKDPRDQYVQQQMEDQDIDSPPSTTLIWKHVWNEGTDGVMDVPIGGVCQILYNQD